jgi:hypothetical protein
VDPPPPPPARKSNNGCAKALVLSALFGLATLAKPAESQTTNCLLPAAFHPYFDDALSELETRFQTDVVDALDGIGLGPLGISFSISSDIINFKTQVFDPLFGTVTDRETWLGAASEIDVLLELSSHLSDVFGSPTLTATCELETTDDLGPGELPYRIGMELSLTGSLVPFDFTNLHTMSPSIAVLPETTFPKLNLTLTELTADYDLKLPLTIDTKRKKFMLGEIQIDFTAAFASEVLQTIPLTDTISQNFAGALDMNVEFRYSSINDWSYTGSYNASLTAETTVATSTANLGLIAFDEDVFDDKPREL